jgi:hypothetical protein
MPVVPIVSLPPFPAASGDARQTRRDELGRDCSPDNELNAPIDGCRETARAVMAAALSPTVRIATTYS